MIDKINTSRILEILRGFAGAQQLNTNQTPNASQDASLQADYAELIKRAADAMQNDGEDLQKIKELLESEQLNSLENAKNAAENIINFGV
ncbi:MAG: hypothetical protein JW804_06420 [Sedimentisphaerales bacterium]|nr:hypothetical protein [Sedimentisphaerales bacterium]